MSLRFHYFMTLNKVYKVCFPLFIILLRLRIKIRLFFQQKNLIFNILILVEN